MLHRRHPIFLILQHGLVLAVDSASLVSSVGGSNFDHRTSGAGPSPGPGVHHPDMSTPRNEFEAPITLSKTPDIDEVPLKNHDAKASPWKNGSPIVKPTLKPEPIPTQPPAPSRFSECLEKKANGCMHAEPTATDDVSATAVDSRKADGKVPGAATSKRTDYLVWDDYFMSVAFLSAMRSKDPSTQVGACIVNEDKRIVGIGYNGFPMGCSDDELPWAREAESELDTKYPYVCHAEMNAILNKNSADVKGCSIYVALFPCNECAKLIIQSGIREVVYLSDKYHHTASMKASRRMLEMAGVRSRQHIPKDERIVIDFSAVSGRR